MDRFHRAIGLSPSLFSVVTIVKRLIPDENNELSSFYSAVSDTITETDLSEYDEVDDSSFDMFYMLLRRAYENLTDATACSKDAEIYISLSPPTPQRPSILARSGTRRLLENAALPTCPKCPYCIAKPGTSDAKEGTDSSNTCAHNNCHC